MFVLNFIMVNRLGFYYINMFLWVYFFIDFLFKFLYYILRYGKYLIEFFIYCLFFDVREI